MSVKLIMKLIMYILRQKGLIFMKMNLNKFHSFINDKNIIIDILDHYNIENDGNHCICPKHADKSLGSCKITEYGCYCFACNQGSDVIDIVESNHPHTSFTEIVCSISEYLGITDEIIIEDTKDKRQKSFFPLNDKSLIFLGLDLKELKYKEVLEAGTEMGDLPEDVRKDKDTREYLLTKTSFPQCSITSIKTLYNEDPEMFWDLIKGKAEEKLEEAKEKYFYFVANK